MFDDNPIGVDLILITLASSMFLSLVFLCAWMHPPMHEAKKADCALVEFSPDYSAEIKQLCREARRNK